MRECRCYSAIRTLVNSVHRQQPSLDPVQPPPAPEAGDNGIRHRGFELADRMKVGEHLAGKGIKQFSIFVRQNDEFRKYTPLERIE